jgi:L-lactate dehydrogenase (cytochrome)
MSVGFLKNPILNLACWHYKYHSFTVDDHFSKELIPSDRICGHSFPFSAFAIWNKTMTSMISLPTTDDARTLAKSNLPALIFDFIDGAAGLEHSAQANVADLDMIKLIPRVLRDVDKIHLGTHFLGKDYSYPFGIAPMGMCNLAWPGTDLMFADQAMQNQIPVCVSTASSTSLEDMLIASHGLAWFQLYVTGAMDLVDDMIQRAESAGYETLVLTVDVPKLGKRPRDLRNGFKTPFKMRPDQFFDFALHPRWSITTLLSGIPTMANYSAGPNSGGYDRTASRKGANWDYLQRLRDRWKKKLVVKGVLNPEDALRIKQAGADAIYVSNHGGRQLDSAPSTIRALPAVRQVVGPEYPIIIDGGIRSGEDIVKCLAAGANFAMLGRPFLYATAANGAQGLENFIGHLKDDVSITLAQIGVTDINQVPQIHQ